MTGIGKRKRRNKKQCPSCFLGWCSFGWSPVIQQKLQRPTRQSPSGAVSCSGQRRGKVSRGEERILDSHYLILTLLFWGLWAFLSLDQMHFLLVLDTRQRTRNVKTAVSTSQLSCERKRGETRLMKSWHYLFGNGQKTQNSRQNVGMMPCDYEHGFRTKEAPGEEL